LVQNIGMAEPRRLELTASEAAKLLGVSLSTVRRWSDAGVLPTYRTPGGQRRYSRAEVERFVASLQEQRQKRG
jgi:excisionase family DNA binding protein